MIQKAESAFVAAKRTFHLAIECHLKNFERFIVLDDVRSCLIHIDERLHQLESELAEFQQASQPINPQHSIIQISFSEPGAPVRNHTFVYNKIKSKIPQESSQLWMSSIDKKGFPIDFGTMNGVGHLEFKEVGYRALDAFLQSLGKPVSGSLTGVAKAIAEDIAESVQQLFQSIQSSKSNTSAEVYGVNLCIKIEGNPDAFSSRILNALKQLFVNAKVTLINILPKA